MDVGFQQLLPQIREALLADGTKPQQVSSSQAIAELLPQIREAMEKDDVAFGEDDAKLAAQASELLPRLSEKIGASYDDARARLTTDAPWALMPMDWEVDLLGPLGKGRSETVHTQCLAYLLDPKKPHGLGVRVLREFFSLMGRLIPGDDIFERLSKESEENTQTLRRIKVSAEETVDTDMTPQRRSTDPGSRRCDIWLELADEHRSLIVVIENKIDAGEQGDQLSAYEQAVWQRARARRRLNFEAKLVFLTPEGREPDEQADKMLWLPMNYKQLAAALVSASRDAGEPGKTYLMLYVASILKHVLRIPSVVEGVERVRQLPYLNEVIEQGANRG